MDALAKAIDEGQQHGALLTGQAGQGRQVAADIRLLQALAGQHSELQRAAQAQQDDAGAILPSLQ